MVADIQKTEIHELTLENRRLRREAGQRERDLVLLLSVTQVIALLLKSNQIIDSTIDVIAQSLEMGSSCMCILTGGTTQLVSNHGFDEDIMRQFTQIRREDIALDGTAELTEPVAVTICQSSADPLIVSLEEGRYKSLLRVPITAARATIGWISIATRTEHMYSSAEIDLLRAIGRITGTAVRNTELSEDAVKAETIRQMESQVTASQANIYHELRTPLTAIKGFANSLLQTDINFDEETRTSFIRTIDSEADRLNSLIEDLLMASRIESGALKLRRETHTINEIVDTIKDRLFSNALQHNLRIGVAEQLPTLSVDSARIGQVITNLVENAVKYSEEGTEICINAEQCENQIIVSITDNGCGIPPEYHEKIFSRFNQIASSNSKKKSNGLGLFICRGIIETHGGRIWVQSEPGKGTKMSFALPVS